MKEKNTTQKIRRQSSRSTRRHRATGGVITVRPIARVGSRTRHGPRIDLTRRASLNPPDKVHARRERIDVILLHTRIVNANLRICEITRNTRANAHIGQF